MFSLYFRYFFTIHILFFVTRLIINKLNIVQWVDFKLENVLVSLHSLKTMVLGSILLYINVVVPFTDVIDWCLLASEQCFRYIHNENKITNNN